MQVLLYPNRSKDENLTVTRRVAALLQQSGAAVLLPDDFAGLLGDAGGIRFLPPGQAWPAADVVLTIGGDGTLLQAGADCVRYQKPVLGINLGRTGFLATCEVSELADKIPRLAGGAFGLQPRSVLRAECDARGWQQTAINDVVLYGASRLHPMDYSILCDGVPVGSYRCDGIIAATPTGSTAYALSAGGPVLDALAPVVEVIPICAHGGRMPPLVFAAGRQLTIRTEPENRDAVFVCADSQNPCRLAPGDAVALRVADEQLPLISFDHAEQFRALLNKLMRR